MANDRVEQRKEELTGNEVIKEVYSGLLKLYPPILIKFEKPVKCLSGYDDDVRTTGVGKVGYTMFDEAVVIGEKYNRFILAVSTETVGYTEVSSELKLDRIYEGTDISPENVALIIARIPALRNTALAIDINDGGFIIGDPFRKISDERTREILDLGVKKPENTNNESKYIFKAGVINLLVSEISNYIKLDN